MTKEELEKENIKLQAEIEDWQSEYVELENFKNNEIAELKKENKELRDNYEQYKTVAEPEIAALKNEIVNLKGVIESLLEQRDGLEKEKCELPGIIQGKDKAIADLKKENADLQKHRDKDNDLL